MAGPSRAGLSLSRPARPARGGRERRREARCTCAAPRRRAPAHVERESFEPARCELEAEGRGAGRRRSRRHVGRPSPGTRGAPPGRRRGAMPPAQRLRADAADVAARRASGPGALPLRPRSTAPRRWRARCRGGFGGCCQLGVSSAGEQWGAATHRLERGLIWCGGARGEDDARRRADGMIAIAAYPLHPRHQQVNHHTCAEVRAPPRTPGPRPRLPTTGM